VGQASVRPSALSFGFVTVGSTALQSFTITNVGTGPISGTVTSSDPAFVVFTGSSYSLAPGQSATTTIQFRPAAVQGYLATIVFQDVGRTERPVNGGGVAQPEQPPPAPQGFTVSPMSIEFGDVPVGQSGAAQLTIAGTGNDDVNGIVQARGVFQIAGSPVGFGPPGFSSQAVTVYFSPATAQSYTDRLFLTVNGQQVTVAVHGNGTGSLTTHVPTSFTLTHLDGTVSHWTRETGLADHMFTEVSSTGGTITYETLGRIADGTRFGTVVTEQFTGIHIGIYIPDIGQDPTVQFNEGGWSPFGTMSDAR
jgi:hypothetical protein